MSDDTHRLLALDDLARAMGCGGLNPRLRAALLAPGPFGAVSAGPVPVPAALPEGVLPFPDAETRAAHRAAR